MSEPPIKVGRPHKGESRSKLKVVTFRLDEETLAALRGLETAVGPKIRGRTSVILRKLILDARDRAALEK